VMKNPSFEYVQSVSSPCIECDGRLGYNQFSEVCKLCTAAKKHTKYYQEAYNPVLKEKNKPKRIIAEPSYHRPTYSDSDWAEFAEMMGCEDEDEMFGMLQKDIRKVTGLAYGTISNRRVKLKHKNNGVSHECS